MRLRLLTSQGPRLVCLELGQLFLQIISWDAFLATLALDLNFLHCSKIIYSATMQRPCALLCLAAAVSAFQPPAARSLQLTQMYGFDNPASRPKYDHSVQPFNVPAA